VEAVEGDRADRRVKLRYLDQAGGGVELRDDSILKPARGRRVRTD
jgi:hypothetical protein